MERFDVETAPSKSTSITLALAAGILTSVFALGLNSALRAIDPKLEPMTWYFKGTLPWGPILVGLVAGSGYVFVAFRRGVRATIVLIASIIVLQFICYGYAQFAEYRRNDPRAPDGSPIPFLTYYDQVTQNIAVVDENRPNRRPKPLGRWGYGIRLFEIAGFLVGAIGPLLFLYFWPYCHRCGVFMNEEQIAVLPWGLEEFEASRLGVAKTSVSGDALWREIERMARENDAIAFRTLLQTWRPRLKENDLLAHRLGLLLGHCPKCAGGFLRFTSTTGQKHGMQVDILTQFDLSPEFVREILRE